MADYEPSACPSCGDPDCSFPVECAESLVEWIRRCDECSRIFDLRDTDDNYEWHYGHDCEVAA